MKRTDWGLEIIHSPDGFVVRDNEGELYPFRNTDEDDEYNVTAGLEMLWFIVEYFGISPSRYAKRRVAIYEIVGDKYELKKGERIKKEAVYVLKEKNGG